MATCHKTRTHYWGPLLKLMTDIGVSPPTGHAELSAFVMLGRAEDEKAANPTQGLLHVQECASVTIPITA